MNSSGTGEKTLPFPSRHYITSYPQCKRRRDGIGRIVDILIYVQMLSVLIQRAAIIFLLSRVGRVPAAPGRHNIGYFTQCILRSAKRISDKHHIKEAVTQDCYNLIQLTACHSRKALLRPRVAVPFIPCRATRRRTLHSLPRHKRRGAYLSGRLLLSERLLSFAQEEETQRGASVSGRLLLIERPVSFDQEETRRGGLRQACLA